MFLAYGAAIDHRDLPTTSIMQMAPTIMQAMGLPLQPQHRGQPMDIFTAAFQQHTSEHRQLDTMIDDLTI